MLEKAAHVFMAIYHNFISRGVPENSLIPTIEQNGQDSKGDCVI